MFWLSGLILGSMIGRFSAFGIEVRFILFVSGFMSEN